jgi:trehalose 6-phosphate synthase/phosphatase
MNQLAEKEIKGKYDNAYCRLILLDYDGTLVNHTRIPSIRKLSRHLSEILLKFIEKPGNDVYIITGRGHKDIEKILKHLPVNIIADHGAMIREGGKWKNRSTAMTQWKDDLIPLLQRLTDSCPGSFVEEKSFSLAWHYRNADPETGFSGSRELIRVIERLTHSFNLKILDGNKIVEVISMETGKGNAVERLLKNSGYDFILSIGDDATDEEMFHFLSDKENAITIRVGNGTTFAKNTLPGIDDVLSLLKQLSE